MTYRLCKYSGVYELYSNNSFSIYHCNNCDFRYKDYPEHYDINESQYENGKWIAERDKLKSSCSKSSQRRFRAVKNYLLPGEFLEIGPGPGWNLKHAQAIGYKPIGIEPSRTNVEYIRRTHGTECLVGRLEDANIKPNSIDNVWVSHVFEHVEDPRRLALNISDILRTNGRLLIWTPSAASYAEPLFKDYCAFYNTFDHVSLFSPESISFLASVSGLQVEYIRTGEAHYDFAWNLIQYFKVKFTGRRCRLLRREASKGRIDVYTDKKVFSLVSAMANAFRRTSVVWGQPFKIFALAGRGSELHCILTKK